MYQKSLGKPEKEREYNFKTLLSARYILLSPLTCFRREYQTSAIALKSECLNRHTVLLPEDSCNAQSAF